MSIMFHHVVHVVRKMPLSFFGMLHDHYDYGIYRDGAFALFKEPRVRFAPPHEPRDPRPRETLVVTNPATLSGA